MKELSAPDSELIVSMMPVMADAVQSLLISLVPREVDIETLRLRMEEGGLVFKDEKHFVEFEPCRCRLITIAELQRIREASLATRLFHKAGSFSL